MKKDVVSGWKAMLAAIAFAFVSAPASADIVSTDQVMAGSDREKVRAFLEREGVEDRLKTLGVAPELARKRVDAMTDEEIRVVAGRIDTLPAGGALDKMDWILIFLVVLIVLILL